MWQYCVARVVCVLLMCSSCVANVCLYVIGASTALATVQCCILGVSGFIFYFFYAPHFFSFLFYSTELYPGSVRFCFEFYFMLRNFFSFHFIILLYPGIVRRKFQGGNIIFIKKKQAQISGSQYLMR